jgi:hypothetical protein
MEPFRSPTDAIEHSLIGSLNLCLQFLPPRMVRARLLGGQPKSENHSPTKFFQTSLFEL